MLILIATALALQEPKVEWTATFDEPVFGTPAVEEGLVYAASSKGKVRAMKLETGATAWEVQVEKVSASVVVLKKKVLVPQEDGTVVILEAATGAKAGSVACAAGSVLSRGKERVYASGHCKRDKFTTVNPGRSLACVDAEKGKALWTVDVKGGAGPATEGGDRVYVGNLAGGVECFEVKTGKSLWVSEGAAGGQVATPPVVTKDRIVVQSFGMGGLGCVDAKTGKKKWGYAIKDGIQPGLIALALCDGRIVSPSLPEVLCLDLDKGTLAWKTTLSGWSSFSPAPAAVADGKCVVAFEGKLAWLDLAGGKEEGSLNLGVPRESSVSQPSVWEGKIFVAADTKVMCVSK